MRIPPDRLEPATLRRVIEEVVTRDGTELSDTDAKVSQVLRQLEAGRVELHYDEESGTMRLVRVDGAADPDTRQVIRQIESTGYKVTSERVGGREGASFRMVAEDRRGETYAAEGSSAYEAACELARAVGLGPREEEAS